MILFIIQSGPALKSSTALDSAQTINIHVKKIVIHNMDTNLQSGVRNHQQSPSYPLPNQAEPQTPIRHISYTQPSTCSKIKVWRCFPLPQDERYAAKTERREFSRRSRESNRIRCSLYHSFAVQLISNPLFPDYS